MTLSAEELATAQKAYSQNREYLGYRWWCFLVAPMMILSFGLQAFGGWEEGHIGRLIFNLAIVFVLLPLYGFVLSRMRELKSHHADNHRLLEELKQKLGAELPVYDEVPQEHPFLESWNRRLEKRAILWRLDAFLSRKSINADQQSSRSFHPPIRD
ncbi:MAG: hypothetical protein LV480_12040 [Methylacidiphilales bacterium]|nr:hypothetical protein [Candidatus Methylacidiphilales bacterium]